jgi:sRNA-binding carbon storage regulator CsrA
MGLSLSRKLGERIRIQTPMIGDVVITRGRRGLLLIEAPDDFIITREAADGTKQTGQGSAGDQGSVRTRTEPCSL